MYYKYYYIYKIILEKNIKAMYNDNTIIGGFRKEKYKKIGMTKYTKQKERKIITCQLK